jgi:predicted ATPase/DNA-binding XRE family transcriptional regulator
VTAGGLLGHHGHVTTFAGLLRGHREAQALSQEELAGRAGLTAKAVGALERGERRRPYPHTVRALSDALGLDEEERERLATASTPARPAGRRPAGAPQPTAGPEVLLPVAPVLGRDAEIAAVAALLRRPARRLVTLTGPGGVGKTTLALAAARAVRDDFAGGVFVIELADVVDHEDVLPVIATSTGTVLTEQPVTGAALAAALTGRRVLLVLDNLERLLDAGPALADLVVRCPDLMLLATSRAVLRVRPEQEVRVGPLSPVAAEQLFRERATAAGVVLDDAPETAAAVAAVCARADGLPLALELAAAVAAVFGPVALLARVDGVPVAPRDLPPRQRSMAATLAWSHALLSARAQALLARLSVAQGGFSLSLAEEIGTEGASGSHPGAVVAALAELVEHSLVTRLADVEGTERFRLLEPVRQDAAARLAAAEAVDARRGLVRWMLETARDLAEELHGPRLPVAVRLLDADRSNVRAAYLHLLDDGRLADAVELLGHLWHWMAIRGHGRDAAALADRARDHPLDGPVALRWLLTRANIALYNGELTTARRLAEDAAERAGQHREDGAAADAALAAAWAAAYTGDPVAAGRLVARASAHDTGRSEGRRKHSSLLTRSMVALSTGDVDGAERHLREAETLARGLGPFHRAIVLRFRSFVTDHRGDHAASARLVGESLLLFLEVEAVRMLAFTVPDLAAVAVRLGELDTGARLFGAARRYVVELDVDAAFRTRDGVVHAELARARDGLGEQRFTAAYDAGRRTTVDDLAAIARTYAGRDPAGPVDEGRPTGHDGFSGATVGS